MQMGKHFKLTLTPENILEIEFLEPTTNAEIVKEVKENILEIKTQAIGSKMLKIKGTCSLGVKTMLIAEMAHVVPAIAVFDPKSNTSVVLVSSDPKYSVGELI